MDRSDTNLGLTMARQLQLAIVNSCFVMSYLKYLNNSPAPSCLIQYLNHYLAFNNSTCINMFPICLLRYGR